MARDPQDYRFSPENGPEHYPQRQEDEGLREHLARLDGEELIAAFNDPDFGRDDPELAWMPPGGDDHPGVRAGAMAGIVLDGLLRELGESPRVTEGRVQYAGPYDAEHDGGYRERYGDNWEDCATTVNNLADAVVAAGTDMVEEGLVRGDPGLITGGRELAAYSSGLQRNILEDGRMTMELHLAERSIQWDLPSAEAQDLEQALDRMMEAGRTDWPNVLSEEQNDHIRERIALSFVGQIRETSLEGNRESVLQAWDSATETGDPAARERAGCVGLALQSAAARILDPADPEGPMGMTWQGLAHRSGEQTEEGLTRARQMEEGIRAVCGALVENAGLLDPETATAMAAQAALAGIETAGKTLEGLQAWLDSTANRLEDRHNDGPQTGLDELANGLNRKALEFFNEAVESLDERLAGGNGAREWDGLTPHEATRLRAALAVEQFRDTDILESLVQRSREARQSSLEPTYI